MIQWTVIGLALLGLQQDKPEYYLPGAGFGRAMLSVSDQDGDQISELLIADSTVDQPGSVADALFVYSPGAKKLLRVIDHGLRVFDGQHVLDRLTRTTDSGADFVYYGETIVDGLPRGFLVSASSRTGKEWARIRFDSPTHNTRGPKVIVLGEVDDVLGEAVLLLSQTGLPGDGATLASIFSLASGKRVRDFSAQAIVPVGDLNQDGVRDVIVTLSDSCRALSGANGLALFDLAITETQRKAAKSFEHAGVGDLDADGLTDLALLVTHEYESLIHRTLWVLSGRDGQPLWKRMYLPGVGTARGPLSTIPDRDSDGIPELALLCNPRQDSRDETHGWELFSGATGASLGHRRWGSYSTKWDYECEPMYSLTQLGDLDGDGLPEFAASNTNRGDFRVVHHGFVEIYAHDGQVLQRIRRSDFGPTFCKEDESQLDGKSDD